jgi:hypothetical protein
MNKTRLLPFVVTFVLGLCAALPPARAVTVYFQGVIDSVEDYAHKLDGSVAVGGTFNGSYTFAANLSASTYGGACTRIARSSGQPTC